MAQKWYEKALYVFESEHNDHILKEKALIGLGIAWFNLGKTQKATETIRKARKLFAKEETDEDNAAVCSTDQHKITSEKLPLSQIQGKLNKLSSGDPSPIFSHACNCKYFCVHKP